MMKFTSLLFSLFVIAFSMSGQIQVDPSVTAENAVNNVLLGSGIIAENITFSGDENQIGTFIANGSNMPIGEGVILGTGNVNLASNPGFGGGDNPGPGGNGGGGSSEGGGNNGASDPDLEIIATVNINDAAILEFDFEATGDSLQFNFVFASEEYPEFVCGTVNDAFGFFLSGPGIDGGGVYEDNAVNLAQVPGTDPPVPVTINTVNPGVSGSGSNANCDSINVNWPDYNIYYIANDTQTTDPNVIEYDGFTVVLTAEAQLICGETYHIKMAIGDGGDTAWDSAVFLQGGSFESNALIIEGSGTVTGQSVFAGDSILVEGCNDASFSFFRPNINEADTVRFNILGDAQMGIDYTNIPDSLILSSGQDIGFITFETIDDGIAEGPEEVTIQYIYTNSCNFTDTASATLFIVDRIEPTVEADDITVPCPGDEVTINTTVNGYGGFTYAWSNGSDDPNITVGPAETTVYTVTVTDICDVEVSTDVTVNVVDWPDLVVTPIPATSLCPGDPITLGVEVEGGSPGYTYNWQGLGTDSTLVQNPQITTDFNVSVSDQCETISIDITGTVIPWPGLDIVSLDGTSICPGEPVDIGITVSGGFPGYTYFWEDGLGTEPNVTVSPFINDSFTVTVSDECDSQEAIVNVAVDDLQQNIIAPYDTLICAGDSYAIDQSLITGGLGQYSFFTLESPDSLALTEQGVYTGFQPGSYEVIVTDACQWVFPNVLEIEVEICDTFIPNVFSPDSDGAEGSSIGGLGLNERFFIIGLDKFPNSELYVYNRWGVLVYEDSNYNNSWRGQTAAGNDLEDGVYFYVFRRSDGKEQRGSITLLRKQ